MKKIFFLFFVLATVFFAASVFTSCRTAPAPEPLPEPIPEPIPEPLPELPKEPISFERNEFERRVFELVNLERVSRRLPALIWHDGAAFVAREHCLDMHNNDFMRHIGSDGSSIRDRLERGCIKNKSNWSASIGGGWLTPEAVVDAWMDSPIYRQNILLRDFTHTGVGFFERPPDSNSRFATYWTQNFFVLE